MPTFSSFVLDGGVRGIRVFRTTFVNEKDVVVYLPDQVDFKSSFPANWGDLASSSRTYYLNNYPNNVVRIFLEISSYPANLINTSSLNYEIKKVYLGTLLVGVLYGDIKYFVIKEATLDRPYSFPFGLDNFVTDVNTDIHALTFVNLQFKVPVSGYMDLVTIFGIPVF